MPTDSLGWLRKNHPEVIQAAEAEYERAYSQPIPNLRKRGGLSIGEVALDLFCALKRAKVPDEYLVPTCDREENPDDR